MRIDSLHSLCFPSSMEGAHFCRGESEVIFKCQELRSHPCGQATLCPAAPRSPAAWHSGAG